MAAPAKPDLNIPLMYAREIAAELIELLGDVTDRLEIAGSIRRKKTYVNDIEIVHAPKIVDVPVSLIDDEPVSALKLRLDELVATGQLDKRPRQSGGFTWGPKTQYAIFKGVPVDFFGVMGEAQWGVQLMLRTGPREVSKANVTIRRKGGNLPNDMRIQDGALWRGIDDPHEETFEPKELIPTPEEIDFYNAIDRRYIEPECRL